MRRVGRMRAGRDGTRMAPSKATQVAFLGVNRGYETTHKPHKPHTLSITITLSNRHWRLRQPTDIGSMGKATMAFVPLRSHS